MDGPSKACTALSRAGRQSTDRSKPPYRQREERPPRQSTRRARVAHSARTDAGESRPPILLTSSVLEVVEWSHGSQTGIFDAVVEQFAPKYRLAARSTTGHAPPPCQTGTACSPDMPASLQPARGRLQRDRPSRIGIIVAVTNGITGTRRQRHSNRQRRLTKRDRQLNSDITHRSVRSRRLGISPHAHTDLTLDLVPLPRHQRHRPPALPPRPGHGGRCRFAARNDKRAGARQRDRPQAAGRS
jgi:hypothetical protein